MKAVIERLWAAAIVFKLWLYLTRYLTTAGLIGFKTQVNGIGINLYGILWPKP